MPVGRRWCRIFSKGLASQIKARESGTIA